MPVKAKKDLSGILPPKRPALPPIFLMGLTFWLAEAAALSVSRVFPISPLRIAALLLSIISAAGVALALLRIKRTFSVLLSLLAVFCIGALFGVSFGIHLKNQAEAFTRTAPDNVLVRLQEDARQGMYGWECLATVHDATGKRDRVVIRLKDSLKGDGELRYGDSYRISFTAKSPRFESSGYCWNKGACAVLEAKSVEPCDSGGATALLLAMRNRAIAGYKTLAMRAEENYADETTSPVAVSPNEAPALLAALACGFRSELFETPFYDAVKKCGLAHLVAVSGAHLTVVSAFISGMFVALRLPRKAVFGISTATTLAYLLLSGCPVSALRAAVMSIVAAGSFLGGRRPSALNALGVCTLALMAASPQTALSVSFMLSFASTAGIILFATYIEYACRTLIGGLPIFLASALSLTLASNLVCLPLSVSLFGQFPLISLFANVICTTLFSPLCLLALLLGLLFALAPAQGLALAPVGIMAAQAFCALVKGISQMPYACVPAICDWAFAIAASIVIPLIFWLVWPKITRLRIGLASAFAAIAAVLFVLAAPFGTGTRIAMLDVGQGDSFLVQSDGATLLIDTGNQDKRLLESLARNGVRRIDAVLITHADDDHCGSLRALASSVEIDAIMLAADAANCAEENYRSLLERARLSANEVRFLEVGDSLHVGKTTLRVLCPESFSAKGGNADSVCCMGFTDIDGDGVSDYTSLFTGDAETAQLEKIAEANDIENIDILKAAHHGSKTGLDVDLANRLKARIALISVGANNRYGHPNQEVLDALDSAGSRVFRSDERGDVSCRMTPNSIEVQTQR